MNGMTAFKQMGLIADDLIEESFALLENETDPPIIPKRTHAFARFMNSGWGAAVICVFVGIGVLAAMIWAGRHAPDDPYISIGGSEKQSEDVPTEPPVTMTESSTEVLTEITTEALTEIPTEAQTEAPTEGVLYDPITVDGLTFVSNGDSTCTLSKADTSLAGEVTVPEVSPYGDRVTAIGASAFAQCSGITSVILPDSVTEIGHYGFRYCTNLVSVDLPSTLNKLGMGAFERCISLKKVTLPSGLTEIPQMAFQTCTELRHVTVPEGVKKIGLSAFNGCSKLQTMTLPAELTTVFSSAFLNCCDLHTINFAGSREEWGQITIHRAGNDDLMNAFVDCAID